jgi:hypothetical protein
MATSNEKQCSICGRVKKRAMFQKYQWDLNGFCKMCDPHPELRMSLGKKHGSNYEVKACNTCGEMFRGWKTSILCKKCRVYNPK